MNAISTETIFKLREALGIEPGDPANADDVAQLALASILTARTSIARIRNELAVSRAAHDSAEREANVIIDKLQAELDLLQSESHAYVSSGVVELLDQLTQVTAERDSYKSEVHVLRVRLAR